MVDLWNPGNQESLSKTKRAGMEMRMSRYAVLGLSTVYQLGRTGRSSVKYLGQTEYGGWCRRQEVTSTLLMWVYRFSGWYFEMLSGACPGLWSRRPVKIM